jgi:hypothetical protein
VARWTIHKGTALIIIIGFLVVGAGMIFYSYQVSPTALTDDGYPLKEFLLYFGIFWIVLPIVLLIGATIYIKLQDKRETNLRVNGLRGQAKILSAEQTGRYVNELPQVEFLLEITIEYGEIYQLKHKEVVGMLQLGAIQAGAIIPVYVDPNNKKNILLDY